MLAIEPETPLTEWISRLDVHIARAPSFFSNKPIVVDVSGLGLARSGLAGLVKDLSERGIRILGLSGVEASWASPDLPPVLVGGRAVKSNGDGASSGTDTGAAGSAATQAAAAERDDVSPLASASRGTCGQLSAKPVAAGAKQATDEAPLIVAEPVRSGQSISHPTETSPSSARSPRAPR